MKSCRKRKPRDVQFPRVQFEKARCSGSGGFAAIALSISEIGLRTNGKARFGREFAVARRPLDGRTPRRPPAICYVRSTSTPAVRCAKTPRWCRFRLTRYLVLAGWKPSHSRPSIRFSKPESHSVGRRDADYRNAYELALLRSAAMYLPNFLDGFDRLIAFDAETTGKRTPDAEFVRKQPFAWRAPGIIIEVGFVEMLREGEGWRKGETWSSRVNPDGPIDPEAIKIHRIRPADLKNAPRFPTILPKVKDFVGESPIVAHAYENERDFLDYEFARGKVIEWGESAYPEARYICTQVLFAQLFPGANKSLTSMCDRLVLDSSERDDRHGALLDAHMTADAFMLLEANSSTVRPVRRDHGRRPDRRVGSVNKRHSANAAQIER